MIDRSVCDWHILRGWLGSRFWLLAVSASLFLPRPLAGGTLRHGDSVVTVTNAPRVLVRAAPDRETGDVIAKVAGGVQLPWLAQTDAWFQIRLEDGREGWISREFSRRDQARDLLKVAESRVRIRQGPDVASITVAKLVEGLYMERLSQAGEWYQVRIYDGREGWIRSDLVHPVKREAAASLGKVPEPGVAAAAIPAPEAAPAVRPLSRIRTVPIQLPTSVVGSSEPGQKERRAFFLLLVSLIPGILAFVVMSSLFMLWRKSRSTVAGKAEEWESDDRLESKVSPDPRELAAVDAAISQCLELMRASAAIQLESFGGSGGRSLGRTVSSVLAAHQELARLGLELAGLERSRARILKGQEGSGNNLTRGRDFVPEAPHTDLVYWAGGSE